MELGVDNVDGKLALVLEMVDSDWISVVEMLGSRRANRLEEIVSVGLNPWDDSTWGGLMTWNEAVTIAERFDEYMYSHYGHQEDAMPYCDCDWRSCFDRRVDILLSKHE